MLTVVDLFFNESKSRLVAKALLGLKTDSVFPALLDAFVGGWPVEDVSEVIELRRRYLLYLWNAQSELLGYIVRVDNVAKQFALHPVNHIRPWKFSLLNFNEPFGERIHNDLQLSLKTLKQKTQLDKFTRGATFKVKVIIINASKYPSNNLSGYVPRKLRRAFDTPDFKLVIITGVKTFPLYNIAENFKFNIPEDPMSFVVSCDTKLSLCQLLMIYASISNRKKPHRSQLRIPCFSTFQIDFNSMKMFNELGEFPGWDEKE